MNKTYVAFTVDEYNSDSKKFDNLEEAREWIKKWKKDNQKAVDYFEIEEGLEIEYTIMATDDPDGWTFDYQVIETEKVIAKRTER